MRQNRNTKIVILGIVHLSFWFGQNSEASSIYFLVTKTRGVKVADARRTA